MDGSVRNKGTTYKKVRLVAKKVEERIAEKGKLLRKSSIFGQKLSKISSVKGFGIWGKKPKSQILTQILKNTPNTQIPNLFPIPITKTRGVFLEHKNLFFTKIIQPINNNK